MIVYKITNKINDKCYIGQTVKKLSYRMHNHFYKKSRCHALKSAIKKYSKENFEYKILAKCSSREEMNHREAYYIKLFDTLAPNGYNLTTGGDNYIVSEETKKKLSKIRGEDHWMWGRKLSEETKEKIRQTNLGKKQSLETIAKKIKTASRGPDHHRFGKGMPDHVKKCLKEGYDKNKEKILKNLRENAVKKRISVICNETGIIYNSMSDAAKDIGLKSNTNISRNINGFNKTVKGLTFSRYDGDK